jgi:NADPH:quinone reductase-like Zn-dependent oxidoreductase
MPKAVQLSAYGGLEQVKIVDVSKPQPKAGEVVVRVIAAGTNPGEISIREGYLKDMYPMAFPFGQGSDFSGRVDTVGPGITAFAVGDAVMGWSEVRSAQAEYVLVGTDTLIAKPPALDWFRAGSLKVVASTAIAAVRAVALKPGDTVAVSGAAGGVGSLAVQLAQRTGARVIGIASAESAPFLRSVGVEPITYGDGLAERVRAAVPNGLNAFIDLFGGGYIELAVTLGVKPERINTIIDFAGAQKFGTKSDGSGAANTREALESLATAIAWGDIIMPLTAIYPFAMVKDAYTELAKRKAHGKIVLALEESIKKPLRQASP